MVDNNSDRSHIAMKPVYTFVEYVFFICLRLYLVIDQIRFRPSIRPKIISRIFGQMNIRQVLSKMKKVLKSNFFFQSHFFEKVNFKLTFSMFYACMHCVFLLPINQLELGTVTPENICFSYTNLTFQCLLPCAKYSLLAEYLAAFFCLIFVFGRNKKIRFRSITTRITCYSFHAVCITADRSGHGMRVSGCARVCSTLYS
jgi:hypothetical protein